MYATFSCENKNEWPSSTDEICRSDVFGRHFYNQKFHRQLKEDD